MTNVCKARVISHCCFIHAFCCLSLTFGLFNSSGLFFTPIELAAVLVTELDTPLKKCEILLPTLLPREAEDLLNLRYCHYLFDYLYVILTVSVAK